MNKKSTILAFCMIPLLLLTPIVAVTGETGENWGVNVDDEIIFTAGYEIGLELDDEMWDLIDELYISMFEGAPEDEFDNSTVDMKVVFQALNSFLMNIKVTITGMELDEYEYYGWENGTRDIINGTLEYKLPDSDEWLELDAFIESVAASLNITNELGGIDPVNFTAAYISAMGDIGEMPLANWQISETRYNSSSGEWYDVDQEEIDMLNMMNAMNNMFIPVDTDLSATFDLVKEDYEEMLNEDDLPEEYKNASTLDEFLGLFGVYDINVEEKSMGAKFSLDEVDEDFLTMYLEELATYNNITVNPDTLAGEGEGLIKFGKDGILVEDKITASGTVDMEIEMDEKNETIHVSFSSTQRIFRGEASSIEARALGDNPFLDILAEIPGYPVAIIAIVSTVFLVGLTKSQKRKIE